MRNVKSKFGLKNSVEDRPWLKEKVYAPKRERTVDLVKQTIDCLLKEKQKVSITTVIMRSKDMDKEGRGVSQTAILTNEEARKYYEQHRTWKPKYHLSRPPLKEVDLSMPIKIDRDLAHARYRYLKMSKAELVARLLAVEQKHAEQEERWFKVNEELMTWRSRIERD